MAKDMSKLAEKVVTAAKQTAERLAQVKGFNLNSVKGVIRVVPLVVEHVEEIGKEGSLNGEEKKALAIEVILKLVKLPWWVPQSLVRVALDAAIDTIVDLVFKKK